MECGSREIFYVFLVLAIMNVQKLRVDEPVTYVKVKGLKKCCEAQDTRYDPPPIPLRHILKEPPINVSTPKRAYQYQRGFRTC